MRVVAGTYRGRRLVTPAGAQTRPTADRVREAVFSMLGPLEGCDVLDLFAGSGAMAVEALSRGARSAVCVDSSPAAIAAMTRNRVILDDATSLEIWRSDWRGALRRAERARRVFGLCLLDPPYSLLPRIAGELAASLVPVLQVGATIVVESAASHGPVEIAGLSTASRTDRTYGSTSISIIRTGEPE